KPPIREIAPPERADPFRYGWRMVKRMLPDGGERWDRIPLTREDILHPQIGDFRMHSDEHTRTCKYLHNVMETQVADIPGAVALHDVRHAWANPNLEPHSPDIAVTFGIKERRNWSTFDETREGTRPTLIIEITSPSYRNIDLVNKLDEYEQAEVAFYVIIDSHRRRGRTIRRLLGYQLTLNGYTAMTPNERGWLWLEPVNCWIGLTTYSGRRNNRVECYDEDGNAIGDYLQVTARAKAAEARAEAEAKARMIAEARLRELEAELRRLRGSDN
ncbi:MAG: Uma2 family endonuclease, partial [Anaerolineales bacterium]